LAGLVTSVAAAPTPALVSGEANLSSSAVGRVEGSLATEPGPDRILAARDEKQAAVQGGCWLADRLGSDGALAIAPRCGLEVIDKTGGVEWLPCQQPLGPLGGALVRRGETVF